MGGGPWSPPRATSGLRERYAAPGAWQGGPPSRGGYISCLEVSPAVGRRGIKEYRAPEALALIAADREHGPLVCSSCSTRSIARAPRRRGGRAAPLAPERVTLTCQGCGRHPSYIERGPTAPRDETMDPHIVRL